jgi:hypothetical protein
LSGLSAFLLMRSGGWGHLQGGVLRREVRIERSARTAGDPYDVGHARVHVPLLLERLPSRGQKIGTSAPALRGRQRMSRCPGHRGTLPPSVLAPVHHRSAGHDHASDELGAALPEVAAEMFVPARRKRSMHRFPPAETGVRIHSHHARQFASWAFISYAKGPGPVPSMGTSATGP